MKECSKCKVVSENFYKDKRSKDGFRSSCKICDSIIKKNYALNNPEKVKEKNKKKYEKNIQKVKLYNKRYNIMNKEKISETKKEYYSNNKETILESKKKYYIDNKEMISIKKSDYFKNKMRNNTLFRFKYRIKNFIYLSLYNNGFTKKSKTYEILGCSFDFSKLYIESKFEDWMNWDNYGLYNGTERYGWDIDHKIPTSSATSESELLRLNQYTNLQPLCSYNNRDIKRDII
jgi:hypothetical protein